MPKTLYFKLPWRHCHPPTPKSTVFYPQTRKTYSMTWYKYNISTYLTGLSRKNNFSLTTKQYVYCHLVQRNEKSGVLQKLRDNTILKNFKWWVNKLPWEVIQKINRIWKRRSIVLNSTIHTESFSQVIIILIEDQTSKAYTRIQPFPWRWE